MKKLANWIKVWYLYILEHLRETSKNAPRETRW